MLAMPYVVIGRFWLTLQMAENTSGKSGGMGELVHGVNA